MFSCELVDRTLKICNTWQAFIEEIASLTFILKKSMYPSRLIERIINRSVTQYIIGNYVKSTGEQAPNTFYFKLPYIGYFSSIAQKRICRLSHFYCNNANIVLAFSSFKVGSPMDSDHVWFINFRALAVQLAMSVRPPDISTHL